MIARRMLFVVCLVLPAGGCLVPMIGSVNAPVLSKDEAGIWFREPSIGDGDMVERATKHCAQYGRIAVYRATLPMAQGYAAPVVVFDCQVPGGPA